MTWVKLYELREGAVFETKGGIRAVKSEYHYQNREPQCTLLESGEYAHFAAGGQTEVRELPVFTWSEDRLLDRDAAMMLSEAAALNSELVHKDNPPWSAIEKLDSLVESLTELRVRLVETQERFEQKDRSGTENKRMNAREFTLTEDHIKLLRRACVGWQDCETGAPEINPKRPYGNSSVSIDVAEILGISIDWENGLPDETAEKMMDLHRETEFALEIVLRTGGFVPGKYKRGAYDSKWVLIERFDPNTRSVEEK